MWKDTYPFWVQSKYNKKTKKTMGTTTAEVPNKVSEKQIENIAKVCHNANKAFCEVNNDPSQKDWEQAEEWQRNSAIAGVKYRLENPTAPTSAQHDAWMADKVADGWAYGETKDAEKKTHPCIVPYDELPDFQKQKDALFVGIVDSLKP